MDLLKKLNEEKHAETLATRERVLSRREKQGYVSSGEYLISRISEEFAIEGVKLEFVNRTQFGYDIALTVPGLLKQGPRPYVAEVLPVLEERVRASALFSRGDIAEVKPVGIYLNMRLSDEFLFSSVVDAVARLGVAYGESDGARGKQVVLDYSHPNVAKHLHAGHIRSTILGEVLAHIYEAVGYTAHGVNHINDWGGFGNLMEAYHSFGVDANAYENKNDFLYDLYLKYRALEKEAEAQDGAGPYQKFKEKADERFRALERGEKDAVELWQKMVAWSLEDFNRFYDLITIHLDYLLGESFYAARGTELVEEAISRGTAVMQDGAAVVRVGSDVDFVVRRSDESTIYSTRDLAALEYRSLEFQAERIVYVVGQEQTDYFARLFKAADIMGIVKKGTVLEHVPFGFYVAAGSKKKLSSREGAHNVVALLNSAVGYFREKYPDLSESDARAIAIGSVCFNDIKKNRMMAVELDTGNVQKMIQGFEESGAAYVMYAITRARSIFRKAGTSSSELLGQAIATSELLEKEVVLLKHLARFADVIRRAAEVNEPSILAEYLLTLAQEYNAYYEAERLLDENQTWKSGVAYKAALTAAVIQVLTNGLRLCHVAVPEKM